ncbi:hypothetical protein [Actinacidiphila glaucinigra]|uniref:hypothetical protein n=1 Tax=Actinacidiphila glaucinigra TaxID=235986 RepID=UPI00366C24D6
MTNPRLHELPHHQALLDGTDWASLATVRGTGESLPAALKGLLSSDPVARSAATRMALGAVTHQNTIYEATVPVALYVAAILGHPVAGMAAHRPTLVVLLEWLSDTAYDADDACVAIAERCCDEGCRDECCRQMREFRDVRPAVFSGVHPLLGHDDADVRDAALVAAIPLAEHPVLTLYRTELVDHARRLLATSTHRRRRYRVLDAMKAWGHDTGGLESADEAEARGLRARRMAERHSWTGGYSEDPPF